MEDRSKNKHDHIETQIQNMFVTMELLYGTRGKKERKRKGGKEKKMTEHQ
jgi:hypothetical protein